MPLPLLHHITIIRGFSRSCSTPTQSWDELNTGLGYEKKRKRSENDTQTCYMWGSEFGFNSEQNRHFLSEGLTNMNMTRSSWRKHFCRVMEGGRGSNMIWSLRSTGMKSSLSLYIFIFFFKKKKIQMNKKSNPVVPAPNELNTGSVHGGWNTTSVSADFFFFWKTRDNRGQHWTLKSCPRSPQKKQTVGC